MKIIEGMIKDSPKYYFYYQKKSSSSSSSSSSKKLISFERIETWLTPLLNEFILSFKLPTCPIFNKFADLFLARDILLFLFFSLLFSLFPLLLLLSFLLVNCFNISGFSFFYLLFLYFLVFKVVDLDKVCNVLIFSIGIFFINFFI